MTELASLLSASRLVELTQPLGPGTSLWPGSRPFVATTIDDYETTGCYDRELVAAPLRFVDGSGTPARVFAIVPPDA